jgi:exonuclease SbcD
MMRIAHFSDLHYGTRTLPEADRCFAAAIDRARELAVDAAVISGDATDHVLELHSPAARALAARVRCLADHCPVLMLQGTHSHEPPGTLAVFKLLGGRHPVHVSERIEQVALTADGLWVPSLGWRFAEMPAGSRAVFSCLPAVNKAQVAATVAAEDAAHAVGEHVAAVLSGFAPGNHAAHARGIATIGVSHGTVFGCVSEHGVPMAGFDHEFTTGALFAAGARAFMLGHIHKHQTWSIGRFHHGELGDKGFVLWSVAADGVDCSLQPTPARRTVDIMFDGRPDLDALREAAADAAVAGATVRVRWTVAEEDRDAVDQAAMRQLLAAAADVKLEGRIVPVVRTRAAGIAQLAGMGEKVTRWAEVTQCAAEPLLRCLEQLQCGPPEEITENLLAASPAPVPNVGADADEGAGIVGALHSVC